MLPRTVNSIGVLSRPIMGKWGWCQGLYKSIEKWGYYQGLYGEMGLLSRAVSSMGKRGCCPGL